MKAKSLCGLGFFRFSYLNINGSGLIEVGIKKKFIVNKLKSFIQAQAFNQL
jgi:hypothetical protein